jgi:transposase
MSNIRRSWSKRGERTVYQNQQEFANRYLYSAIDPITGDSFHLSGLDDTATIATNVFLSELQRAFPNEHLVIVWDNAPFHKPKLLRRANMTLISLPSYSPQLNPIERFFGEMRKFTANRIFKDGIEELEKIVDSAVVTLQNNKKGLKKLTGYEWIKEQWDRAGEFYEMV